MTDEYIEGSRKGKLVLGGFLLLFILVYGGAPTIMDFVIPEIDSAKSNTIELKMEILNQARLTLLFVLLTQPLYWGISYGIFRYGIRIRNSESYPPPGTSVPFRTKIVRGNKAVLHAKAHYIAAIIYIFLGLAHIYISFRNLQFLKEMLSGA